MTALIITASVIVIALLVLLTKPRCQKGMCPVGGPRWKNILAYLMIRSSWKKAGHVIEPEKVNKRVPPPEELGEENYNDSFVFQGADSEGNLFMSRLGFREGGKIIEVWVWTALGGNVYANTVKVVRPEGTAGRTGIEGGGLRFTCTDPEKGTWLIEYTGKLESPELSEGETLVCDLRLSYEPDSAMYHSGVHMDAGTFARGMAEMPWTREFFDNLKSENQIRIEQGGKLFGTIRIDGKEYPADMTGVRDHSWGKRKWTFIKRYIWNVLSFSDDLVLNGKSYRYLCYTTVNYGTSFKCLVSGWIAGDDSVLPIIAATDQKEIGEDGSIPEQISCRFQPKGSPPLELTIHRTGAEYSWFMGKGDFEVCEAYCTFEIEGCRGVGMSEFGYSKEAGYTVRFPSY